MRAEVSKTENREVYRSSIKLEASSLRASVGFSRLTDQARRKEVIYYPCLE